MARKELNNETLNEMDEQPETNLPMAQTSGALVYGGIGGNVSSEDIQFPRMKLVHGVGKLADKFAPGDLVLDDDALLVSKGEALTVILLGGVLYWKEYLGNEGFQQGMIPRTFVDEKDVHKAGGTTQWGAEGEPPPTFSQAMHLRMLIRKPEGLASGMFNLEFGDGFEYCPAQFDADKQVYKTVGPKVLKWSSLSLVDKKETGNVPHLCKGVVTLSTRMKPTKSGNKTWAVFPELVGFNPDGVVAAIDSMFNPKG